MKRLALILLSLALLTGSLSAGPVEDFCNQFAARAEVRVYRSFPPAGFDRTWLERAKKAECFELLGDVFYPDAKTLNEKDAAAWLALATNPKNYYPAASGTTKPDPHFCADIAFWCVAPDHKNQVYYLASFSTSQVRIVFTGDGATVAMTLELEKLCREILLRTFEQEIKDEPPTSAQQSPAKPAPPK